MAEEAFVTLLYSNEYLVGTVALGLGLRDVGTTKELVVLVTDSITPQSRQLLTRAFDKVVDIGRIQNPDPASVEFSLLSRPELRQSYSKVAVWNQTQYKKVVYLDSDILVLQNIDNLFELDLAAGQVAAAPDIGWPDIFNSGVLVTVPDSTVYEDLVRRALQNQSFDGGDQGLLNQYFSRPSQWHRLPFGYNVTPSSSYQYTPAFRHFRSQVRTIHFIGSTKPWTVPRLPAARGQDDFVYQWQQLCLRHPASASLLPVFESPSHSTPRATGIPEGSAAGVPVATEDSSAAKPATKAASTVAPGAIDPRFDAFGGFYSDNQSSNRATIVPLANRWDPSTSDPPRKSSAEASELKIQYYESAWDRPASVDEVTRQLDAFKPPNLGPSTSAFPWEKKSTGLSRTVVTSAAPPAAPAPPAASRPGGLAASPPQPRLRRSYVSTVTGTQKAPSPAERVFPGEPRKSILKNSATSEREKAERAKRAAEAAAQAAAAAAAEVASEARESLRSANTLEVQRKFIDLSLGGDDKYGAKANAWDDNPGITNHIVRHVRQSRSISEIINEQQSLIEGLDRNGPAAQSPSPSPSQAQPQAIRQTDAAGHRTHKKKHRYKKSTDSITTRSRGAPNELGPRTRGYQFPVTPTVGTPSEEIEESQAFDSWDPDEKLKELAMLPAKLLSRAPPEGLGSSSSTSGGHSGNQSTSKPHLPQH